MSLELTQPLMNVFGLQGFHIKRQFLMQIRRHGTCWRPIKCSGARIMPAAAEQNSCIRIAREISYARTEVGSKASARFGEF